MTLLVAALIGGVSAAPVAAEPAGVLLFGGLTRTYTLHVPPGVARPSALVVNLHSAGSTGRDHAALTRYADVADANGFAVVFPDGVDYSWADGRGASVPDRQGVDDVGFITELVARTTADLGVPPGRVFATGLSAGGFMTNRLGCDRADLFAAIAPVAGTLGAGVGCAPSRPVSVFATHGTADPIVPFGGGPMTGRGGASTVVAAPAMADRWREIDQCAGDPGLVTLPTTGDATVTTRTETTDCAAGTAVVFTRVDGGGHTWPGAPQILGPQEVGLPSRAFDASVASWQFFDTHSR